MFAGLPPRLFFGVSRMTRDKAGAGVKAHELPHL